MVFLASAAPQPPRSDYAGAAALVERIPIDLAAEQKRLGLTVRSLASQLGVGIDTVSRLLSGGTPTQSTILAALRWLARQP